MKRNAKIVAYDGDVRVTVIVKLVSASGALSTTEANNVIRIWSPLPLPMLSARFHIHHLTHVIQKSHDVY